MKIITLLVTVCFALAGATRVQAFTSESENANYVVIGAFAIEEHAAQFVESAKKLQLNPVFEINPNRHLFYVYVLETADRSTAFREATRIRKATPFFDTWVYTGSLGSMENTPLVLSGSSAHATITTDKTTPAGEVATIATVEKNNETMSNEPTTNSVIAATSVVRAETTIPTATEQTPSNNTLVEDAEAGGKNFFFKIFTAGEEKALIGDVDLIDTEKSRKMASYAGNKNVSVQRINRTGKMSFVCEVFGYRKLQKDINFDHPEETDGVVVDGSQTVVPFELSRLQKGDIAVMYNVYFYKDAAIMRPESKYEVASLLEMMNENPKYRIKIHGHTNGGAAGKIISMGESKNFFSMVDTKEGIGSAKTLSASRAEVIREYLLNEGIDPKRMETKAWGGKHPVYDKNGPQAAANVRVEIEILDDK